MDWRETVEAGLERFGRGVARRRSLAIASMLLLALGLGAFVPGLQRDTTIEGYLHRDDPARIAYEAFRHQFGRSDVILIAIRPTEVFDLGFLERLRQLHEEIEERVPHIEEVNSLLNARVTRGEGDELIVEDLLEHWPRSPAEVARVAEIALANPIYEDFLLSADGSLTTVAVRLDPYSSLGRSDDALAGFDEDDFDSAGDIAFITGDEEHETVTAIAALLERYRAADFEIFMAGSPVMSSRLIVEMQRNLQVFLALSLLIIGLLLFALFRRVSGVLLPLLVVGLSVVSTLGALAATGTAISTPTQILPSFLLAVGVGAAIHLLVMFYRHYDRGESRSDAVAHALRHSGLAIVMTGLTTAGGLASFAAAEMAPIAALGYFAPLGIGLGLLFVLVLLPALLTSLPLRRRPARDGAPGTIERTLVAVGELSVRHAKGVLAITAGLVLACLPGLARLELSFDPMNWLPSTDRFVRDTKFIDRALDGSITLEVVVDGGRENFLQEPEVLNRLDELSARVSAIRRPTIWVGKTLSLADVLKEIHQALNENRAEYHAIPQDPKLVAQELLLFENSGSDDLEDLVDSRFSLGRFTLKVPYERPGLYEGFIEEVEAEFVRALGDDVAIATTGFMGMMSGTLNALMGTLVRSYVLALLIITPLMMLLIGTLRGGLASMVPNLAPIVAVLALMGYAGIPLDVFNLMIGAIAIGLAVDDTIHFMHGFRREFAETGDAHEATRATLSTTGQALLLTSIVLSLGFLVYTFASLGNLVNFGRLLAFTIIVAFIADVFVSPALMALLTGQSGPRAEEVPA